MEPQVTIVCTAYNHGKYIKDALEGFVSQKTNFPFIAIVHDDASTDNTAEIIREYAEKYPEIIKPIYQVENQYSKRIGINKTIIAPRVTSKYVAFCEGDDYWTDPLKLQKQYDFMETHPEYTLCVCSSRWLDMTTGKLSDKTVIKEDRDISLEEIIIEEKGRIFQYASFFLYTTTWKQYPQWRGAFGVGDTPLAVHAAINGKVRMLADVMTVYRWKANNSWTYKINESPEKKVRAFEKMIHGWEEFNKETDYKYDSIVTKRIKRMRYNNAIIQGDYRALRSEELRDVYNSRNIKQKFKDIVECKYPRLYKCLRRIL